MGEAKRVRRAKPALRPRPIEPDAITSGTETPGRGVLPPEGSPPRKRRGSVEDPLGDWPETDAAADRWLIDRGGADDTPDR